MNKKASEYTGFPGDLNPDMELALQKFKDEIKKDNATSDPRYDDPYLLRFLRARKFDLEKSKKMFYDFLKWRKEFGTDDIWTFEFPELQEVKTFYPHGYHKTDRQGRPIYIERVALLKIDSLFKVTTEERMLRYYVREYERLVHVRHPACSKAAGKLIQQSLTILDIKDCSMSLLTGKVKGFIKLASGLGQDYYPEILGNMFIVNAPMLFTGAWAIIKGFLDKKTRDKIKIVGSKFQKDLFVYADPDNIPDFLGGNCKCEAYGGCLNSNLGPWLDANGEWTGADAVGTYWIEYEKNKRREAEGGSLMGQMDSLSISSSMGSSAKDEEEKKMN